jgi:DNA-binding XRE family transcriptional regulator
MTTPLSLPDPAATVSKAVVRAAGWLDLSQATLAQVLGVSQATVSRLVAGRYRLAPGRAKEWELALLFVRMFRSLDAILGHGPAARAWLAGRNLALGRPPVEEITTAEGLVRVVHYLDVARGRV